MDSVLLILLIVVGLCILVFKKRKVWKLPPGPFKFPLIGSLHLMFSYKNPLDSFLHLAKKYGGIFTLQLGTVPIVYVSRYEDIKEASLNDELNSRINFDWFLDRSLGKEIGILFGEYEHWKILRKFVLSEWKQYGFGKKNTMEELIEWEFRELIEKIRNIGKDYNGVVHMHGIFNRTFVNIVWSLLTGERFASNDPESDELLHLMDEFVNCEAFSQSSLLVVFPFLSKWMPVWSGFSRLQEIDRKVWKYFEGVVKKYKLKGTYKTNPINIIERFLQKMEEEGLNANAVIQSVFKEETLVASINDLFAGGSDTGANTLLLIIRKMIQYPEIQDKVRKEIESIVGTDRTVGLGDIPKLKYTNATILESFRYMGPVPMLNRRATNSTTLKGFDIPKDTVVNFFLHGCHNDKTTWGDPDVFRPERFLDSNDNLINTEKVIPFSLGKRNCVGSTVGQSSVFLGFTSLIQNFKFEHNPTTGVPSDEIQIGFTISPLPYSVIITPV